MEYSTVVLTAPRRVNLLKRTLASLEQAGWPNWIVTEDKNLVGQWYAWYRALDRALSEKPDADAYFVLEDDVVFCNRLREYLDFIIWPEDEDNVALVSPYLPAVYMLPYTGPPCKNWRFNVQDRGHHLVGALSWIIPPKSAHAIMSELANLKTKKGADWIVGQWAQNSGRTVWYHNPSLSQHTGNGNSVCGHNEFGKIRMAGDFIGETNVPEPLKGRKCE